MAVMNGIGTFSGCSFKPLTSTFTMTDLKRLSKAESESDDDAAVPGDSADEGSAGGEEANLDNKHGAGGDQDGDADGNSKANDVIDPLVQRTHDRVSRKIHQVVIASLGETHLKKLLSRNASSWKQGRR